LQVLDPLLIRTTTITPSLCNAAALNESTPTARFTGTLILPQSSDLNDSALSITISLQRSLIPGQWEAAGNRVWRGGSGQAPTVVFDGTARQVRLVIDPSRPISAGADITPTLH
jgi:hypothetical protein